MRPVEACHKSMHVVLHAASMFCYFIEQTRDSCISVHKKEYVLRPAVTSSLIYNPTYIGNALADFMMQYHLNRSYLYFILVDPLVQEQVRMHHKSHALLKELVQLDSARDYHHTYVGPIDERALFYVSSITKTLLLQLQLMCVQVPCYLQAVRSCLSVQHDLYMYLHRHEAPCAQIAQKINPQTLLIDGLQQSLDMLVKANDGQKDNNLIYAVGSFIGAHV